MESLQAAQDCCMNPQGCSVGTAVTQHTGRGVTYLCWCSWQVHVEPPTDILCHSDTLIQSATLPLRYSVYRIPKWLSMADFSGVFLLALCSMLM